jgi:hypothetical protein
MDYDGTNDGQSKEKKGMERYGDFMIGLIGFSDIKEIEKREGTKKKEAKEKYFCRLKRRINRF